MNLSKPLYTKAIQCPKALWLKKYKKEILAPPGAIALTRFKIGKMLGVISHIKVIPNGNWISFVEIG